MRDNIVFSYKNQLLKRITHFKENWMCKYNTNELKLINEYIYSNRRIKDANNGNI